jgi:hypothetical protein
MKNVYKIVVGKLEVKISLGKPTRRWKNTKGLKEIAYEDVVWTHLAQDKDQWRALVNIVMNLQAP